MGKQIWPGQSLPPDIARKLGLDFGGDWGIDGVYETTLGELRAYQVKYRTRRPALTWRELSTFIGLADRVDQRVLFTNCDDLPELLNQRLGFFCIRGQDLDRLDARDFDAIKT